MIDGIVRVLRTAIGLDASSIGLRSIERAVQTRMAASGIPCLQRYHERLAKEPAELCALIEEVVVPETWFFRDPGAFAGAAQWAWHGGLPSPIRFLSAPCATGEEPYSLVMALLDANLSPARFAIEAVDVSDRVLEHAAAGIYGRNSFRSGDLGFRDRYFRKSAAGHVLDPAVQRLVNFRKANLLEDFAQHPPGCYHAIFCRNLLIYFDAETQIRVLATLRHLLAPEALLFVAPSESGLVLRHGFAPSGLPQAFAFQKCAQKALLRPVTASQNRQPRPAPARAGSSAAPASFAAAPREPAAPPPLDLVDAARLADEGRFSEVSEICHSVIRTLGASAVAYYLLALVSDASNQSQEAVSYYRKALYLDPRHHDALVHYSLLAGRLGDAATAAALRQRVLRLETETLDT